VVPAHLVSAPTAGTGKSYLADLASVLAVGDRCAVLAFSPDPAETEKRLIGAALEGRPIIALDNCTELVAGDFLCQVTERPLMKLRPLGTTDMKTVGNAFTVLLNGNNTVVAGDMVRRIIKCSLDANIESPEKRAFKHNPLKDILADRGKFVAAVLTICRAYVCQGRPDRLPALPSFEAWSDLVRSALVWLGKPDPVETIEELREADPAREVRAKVFDAWVKHLGSERSYQVSEVISATTPVYGGETSGQSDELREALLSVAADYKDPRTINTIRLGKWLTRMQKNISGEHKLTVDRSDKSRPRWQVKPTSPR
jgi:putative DNA primase/helicase